MWCVPRRQPWEGLGCGGAGLGCGGAPSRCASDAGLRCGNRIHSILAHRRSLRTHIQCSVMPTCLQFGIIISNHNRGYKEM
ncbi:hypothetical protein SORBI_3005G156900 [Sorghum bicolor]|uniref:Uncharacterized protein n=1 Tax=Sorghum bicolor TaxID=4558 RepID=A0A1Z5RJP3_SORBI|nr:hypothetical protein SORBI_3005G156900 [Sorghum bicolor]OQU83667.1 hypothetical protein SORBI_3005G156900 [Sorghum bicolor]